MTVKNEANRRRKWAPKARTGCRTCKTRHVKCDEQKPVCRRCHLSGFRCDGYLEQSEQLEDVKPETAVLNTNDGTESVQSEDLSVASVTPGKSDSSSSPASSSSSSSSASSLSSEEDNTSDFGPLVRAPAKPYADETSHSLDFFVNVTSAMVARSRVAPRFWQVLVPQAAWTYPCVRHAMLAASIASESLMKREGTVGKSSRADLQVLTHASSSVRALLSEKVPLDVVLLTSATLGVLDLFQGQWDTACTHVTSGAKLAEQARRDPHGDAYISFYCEAFASALPEIMKPNNNRNGVGVPEKDTVVRLKEAVDSLQLALESFENAIAKVLYYEGVDKDKILRVLYNARTEVSWILEKWVLRQKQHRRSSPDGKVPVNKLRIESPWSKIMPKLEYHLDQGGPFDVASFEIAMERTLPFYVMAKAGPNMQMREDAALLMYLGSQMRGRLAGVSVSAAGDSRLLEGS